MDVEIRSASAADARAIAGVHARSWRAAYRDLLPRDFLAGLDPLALAPRWRRTLASGRDRVRVAEDRGVVVGFVGFGWHADPTWCGRAGEVMWLYVEPERVGSGVGGALFDRAVAELEAAGARWLVVRVLAENTRARRFYERRGLRFDGHRGLDRVGEARVEVVRYARAIAPVIDWRAITRPA